MKVLMGISGGLDSTYAALLLKEAGHTVEGAVLDMHGYTETEEAKRAADAVGIPLHIISCRELFERVVIEDFCREYQSGRTPNPCIICNERVKFRVLYDTALQMGFDRIATGHYARLITQNGKLCLAMAADVRKDQSYMLYRLPQEILSLLVLPMGEIIKEDARQNARARALAVADREESQEICFVKGEDYASFIERRCGRGKEGDFVSEDGAVLGKHKGIIHYTVGQRKGLGIAAASRLFIKQIEPESARIVLTDIPPKKHTFTIDKVCFGGGTEENIEMHTNLFARVRHTATLTPTTLRKNGDEWCATLTGDHCAVTPGQSAVFYRDGVVILGGIIKSIM